MNLNWGPALRSCQEPVSTLGVYGIGVFCGRLCYGDLQENLYQWKKKKKKKSDQFTALRKRDQNTVGEMGKRERNAQFTLYRQVHFDTIITKHPNLACRLTRKHRTSTTMWVLPLYYSNKMFCLNDIKQVATIVWPWLCCRQTKNDNFSFSSSKMFSLGGVSHEMSKSAFWEKW